MLRGSVCLWAELSILWQAVYNCASAFTSCIHRASRSVQVRDSALLRSFLGLCTALHMCVAFYIPRNISKFCKAPCGHCVPPIFLLRFLNQFPFSAAGVTASGSCSIKQSLLMVSDKHHGYIACLQSEL